MIYDSIRTKVCTVCEKNAMRRAQRGPPPSNVCIIRKKYKEAFTAKFGPQHVKVCLNHAITVRRWDGGGRASARNAHHEVVHHEQTPKNGRIVVPKPQPHRFEKQSPDQQKRQGYLGETPRTRKQKERQDLSIDHMPTSYHGGTSNNGNKVRPALHVV